MPENRSIVERAVAIEAADAAAKQPPPKGRKTIGAVALALIAGVIAVEGGYVNNKADPGGETNMGITKRVAVANGYTGPMRTLPREVVENVYYRDYIVAPGYEPLIGYDAAVTEELFDTTVNMGAPRPSRWFQQSINSICGTSIVPDGHVGQATIAAYASCQARIGPSRLCVATLNSLDDKQRAEYERLVRVNPKLRVFLRGWINNRIDNVDRRKCSKGV